MGHLTQPLIFSAFVPIPNIFVFGNMKKKGMLEKVGRKNIRKIENICVFTLFMLGLENRKVKERTIIFLLYKSGRIEK